jgi:hypothetical protein
MGEDLLPIDNGGLGILNLSRMGIALSAQWLWQRRAHPDRPWVVTLPLLVDKKAEQCLAAGCRVLLGDGNRAAFWTDNWLAEGGSILSMAPILCSFVKNRSRSVAAALQGNAWVTDIRGGLSIQAIAEYLTIWDLVQGVFPWTHRDWTRSFGWQRPMVFSQ